jgi:hypothetical protein
MLFFLLALAFYLHRREHRFVAGVVLALQITKPNLTVFFVPLVGCILLVRQDWRTLCGLITGGLGLVTLSWVVLPGWFFPWLQAGDKAQVATITPTLWGLAHDLVGEPNWAIVASLGTALILVGTGALIWRQRQHDWLFSLGLALGVSTLATPYLWAYEQLVLFFLAMIGLYWSTTASQRWKTIWALLWLGVVVALSWSLMFVAMKRGIDTWSAFVTVGILVYFVLAHQSGMRSMKANQEVGA